MGKSFALIGKLPFALTEKTVFVIEISF